VVLLGTQIFKESSGLYQSLADDSGHSLIESINGIVDRARAVLPIPADAEINVSQYAQQGLQFLAANIGGVFSGVAKMLLSTFVFIIAFYFLLKDGRQLKEYLVALSPLADKDDNKIVSRLETAVSASIKGSLTIGLVQGILTGIGFSIFGVPNAVLWGSVAAIAALVPGIGTALVIVPGVAYLFLTGETMSGIGLLAWGVVAVGLIDNILGPRLVGQGMRLHPLAVFLSVMGGLAFFGPLGFLLGPLAFSVCLAFIDIHFSLRGRMPESA
jgi:predicted PurR-regulated permease PerM